MCESVVAKDVSVKWHNVGSWEDVEKLLENYKSENKLPFRVRVATREVLVAGRIISIEILVDV